MKLTLFFAFGAVGVTPDPIATTPPGAVPIDPIGTQPHALDTAVKPQPILGECSACHAGGKDEDGKAFRPWDTWSGTMMANAVRDPLFQAALTLAEQDTPGVSSHCLRCHTPKAFVKGNVTPSVHLDEEDEQGVDCEACHRSIDSSKPLGATPPADHRGPFIGNSRLFWDPTETKHGPFDDANSPSHAAQGNPFTSSAMLCGQCHELASPLTTLHDATGKDLGIPFPLDTTYTEWANSDYGKGKAPITCQQCHMVRANGDALTVAGVANAKEREYPRTHGFVGGNVWGIDAVKAAYPMLAILRAEAFALARESTIAHLESAVRVEILETTTTPRVTVRVRVTNQAGHKFPTGYADGRRAFLRVEALDLTGAPLATIGKYDDATQTLVADPQLHVYEAVHAQSIGGKHLEWHITKHDTLMRDTRIPPRGFTPGPTTRVVGANYRDNADEATFSLDGVDAAKLGTITATVYYQATVREFIEELDAANKTDDRGKLIHAIWQRTGAAAPRAIASATKVFAAGPLREGGSEGDDGEGASNSDGAGGCSCRATRRPSTLLWIVGGLALAPLRRRQRRHCKSAM